MKMKINIVPAQCTLYWWQQFLQFLLELLFILFIATGLWLKIMFLALNLALTKKQKFGECNFLECTSIEHINGRNKTNKYQKSNLLFLQRSNWHKRFWCKIAKTWQKKIITRLTFITLVMWLFKKLLIMIIWIV